MWVSLEGLSASERHKRCEAEASSGRPASVPQLKCVCLNSPFEKSDVQPSCPHLFIPVAFLHRHPRQRGDIILSHKVTISQKAFWKAPAMKMWLIIFTYAVLKYHICTGFAALTGSPLPLSAESILSTRGFFLNLLLLWLTECACEHQSCACNLHIIVIHFCSSLSPQQKTWWLTSGLKQDRLNVCNVRMWSFNQY